MTELWIYALFGVAFTVLNIMISKAIITDGLEQAVTRDESDKITRLRKIIEDQRQEITFYKSRSYGADKKAELLEEEISKLRKK